jgi:hypothetical protein
MTHFPEAVVVAAPEVAAVREVEVEVEGERVPRSCASPPR